jgi:mannose-6-phosphate isomerase-like protein (cupin superfamily)
MGEIAIFDIEADARANTNFRTVVDTQTTLQMALMTLLPGENTGVEMHAETEQFFKIVEGTARFRLGLGSPDAAENIMFDVRAGGSVTVPRRTHHYFECVRGAAQPLKLYTIYSRPEHAPGIVHARMADAQMEHPEELVAATPLSK